MPAAKREPAAAPGAPPLEPMLAREFEEAARAGRVAYPALVQPKLDGVRVLASSGALWSRRGSSFGHLARVRAALRALPEGVVLDGELYAHGLGFQRVVSLVRNVGSAAGERELELHAFDVAAAPPALLPPGAPFAARLELLRALAARLDPAVVRVVETREAAGRAAVDGALRGYLERGYEGAVVRDPASPYAAGRRSAGLLKYKRFATDEFEVVRAEEAGGKDAGTAVLVCRAANGREFRVRPEGPREARAELLARARRGGLGGARLTVRYQELTRGGVPRFPVGVGLRDYE